MKIYYHFKEKSKYKTGGARQIYNALEYFERNNVKVEYLQTEAESNALLMRNPLLSNLWYLTFGLKKIKGAENVLMVDYTGRAYTVLFVLAAKLFLRVRIVVTFNAMYFALSRTKLKNTLDRILSILFIRMADIVITSGISLKKEIVRWGISKRKVITIPPALRREFFNPSFTRPNVDIEGPIKILFIGRLHPIKGVEYLIEAVSLLEGTRFQLIIVGSYEDIPNYTQSIRDKIKKCGLNIGEQVILKGEVKDISKLIELYNYADIFVLPSVWDTSPIAVREAMCFGLPIIATDVGDVGYWVENSVNGFLVPPGDAKALANRLQKLVDDSTLRCAMGGKSREKSTQFRHRTWDDVGKEYYDSILGLFSPHRNVTYG